MITIHTQSNKSSTHRRLLKRDKAYSKYINDNIDGATSFGMKCSLVAAICADPIYQRIEKDDIEERRRKAIRGEFTKEMQQLMENKPGNRVGAMGPTDEFYTMPKVAKQCLSNLYKYVPTINKTAFFIEPSAGNGSFYKLMPKKRRLGFDILPRCDGVIPQDFLKYKHSTKHNEIICLGNPPFGKNSSLAVKFFNHCAEFASIIAFIVPRTFNKNSLQNKLNMNFHLLKSINLDDESFLFGGEPYKVPCCFQIWIKKSTPRDKKILNLENTMFTFVKKDSCPDLAVRRVGGNAGRCTKDIENSKHHSFYFLKLKPGQNVNDVMSHINHIHSEKHFLSIACQSAGVRSISRGEFIQILNKFPLKKIW